MYTIATIKVNVYLIYVILTGICRNFAAFK